MDVFPDMYDMMVAGHVKAGETYEESAVREIAEELGIAGAKPRPLFKFSGPTMTFGARVLGASVDRNADYTAKRYERITARMLVAGRQGEAGSPELTLVALFRRLSATFQ